MSTDNDKMVVQDNTDDQGVTVFDTPEAIKGYMEAAKFLSKAAEKRRRKKTPKGIRKKRTVGKDDSGNDVQVDIVDRPEYQRYLDDHFPGWSTSVPQYSYLTNNASHPILFCCDLTLIIVDNGVKRQIPGTGSCGVSQKEIERMNSQLLVQKRNIALTNAIKVACGWTGAFFDLRADEEARERASMPPSKDHKAEFEKLIVHVPKDFQQGLRAKWDAQSLDSAPQYLKALTDKLKAKEANEKKSSDDNGSAGSDVSDGVSTVESVASTGETS